jgi:DNA-binding transcriptional ArsR family regulator
VLQTEKKPGNACLQAVRSSFPWCFRFGEWGKKVLYLSIDLIKRLLYNGCMDKFSALADPTRRKIIELLAMHGEMPSTEISEHFSISAPAISQHLKVLRQVDWVRVERRAQQRIYRINPGTLQDLEDWTGRMTQLWNQRFDRLDEVLKSGMEKGVEDGQE